jgi:hypothetical protein
MDKYFVFRNYSWIAGAVATVAIVVIVASDASGREGLIASTLGAALGFCYFAQKQKLEELRLFKELFTEFNRRYDEMNERLVDIREGNRHDEAKERKALVDYFNLCAEEYLFFEEGYIHRAAWRSWCRGMLYYLENDGIRHVWDDEVSSDSYYGLTVETIRSGAALASRSIRRSKSARS